MKATAEFHTTWFNDRDEELHIWFSHSPAEPDVNADESIEIERVALKLGHAMYADYEYTESELESIEEECWDYLRDYCDGEEYETD